MHLDFETIYFGGSGGAGGDGARPRGGGAVGRCRLHLLQQRRQRLGTAKTALQPLLPDGFDMERFAFMTGVDTTVGGMECRVTRCGYTGEDGFEIGVTHTKDAVAVAELLLSNENVEPCGLGARDSLRLEAGLCLYGNDLDDTVNPVEGTLLWTIGPKDTRRRTEQGFPGAANMLTAEGKPKKFGRKRVGFMGHTKPARPGATWRGGPASSTGAAKRRASTTAP